MYRSWLVLTQRFSSCIHRALHVRDNKEAQARRGVRPQSASATPKRSKTCEEVKSGVIGSNELKNGRTSVVTCKEMRKARVGWGEGMSSSSKVSDELLQLLHRRTLVYGDSGKDMQNTVNLEVDGCRHSKDPGQARQSLTEWAAADNDLHEASAGTDSKNQVCRPTSQLRCTLTVSTLVDESSSQHAYTRSLTSALCRKLSHLRSVYTSNAQGKTDGALASINRPLSAARSHGTHPSAARPRPLSATACVEASRLPLLPFSNLLLSGACLALMRMQLSDRIQGLDSPMPPLPLVSPSAGVFARSRCPFLMQDCRSGGAGNQASKDIGFDQGDDAAAQPSRELARG